MLMGGGEQIQAARKSSSSKRRRLRVVVKRREPLRCLLRVSVDNASLATIGVYDDDEVEETVALEIVSGIVVLPAAMLEIVSKVPIVTISQHHPIKMWTPSYLQVLVSLSLVSLV